MALKHTRSIKDQTHQQNLESTITDHCRMENLQRSSPLTPLTNTWSTAPEGRSGLTVVRGVAHLSIIWLVVCTSMIPANINTSPPRRPEEDGRNASKYKHVCYRRNMLVIICIHDVFHDCGKPGSTRPDSTIPRPEKASLLPLLLSANQKRAINWVSGVKWGHWRKRSPG